MTGLITDTRLLKQPEHFFSPTVQIQTSHCFFQFQHVDGFNSLPLHKLYFSEAVITVIILIKTRKPLYVVRYDLYFQLLVLGWVRSENLHGESFSPYKNMFFFFTSIVIPEQVLVKGEQNRLGHDGRTQIDFDDD